ncbi:hypothetical protein [Trichormus azollae]|uniref:hypothetical protein n=1 Tax=Trichormus azollae TaxID=1164 RepID=UPI00117E2626|nr:hypothetical protein [Trichormus azollae]
MNQQITFLSDGDDKLPKLISYLNPDTQYLLDWFYITMRIRIILIKQMVRGLGRKYQQIQEDSLKQIKRIKCYLWHGNVFMVLELIDLVIDILEIVQLDDKASKEFNKLLKIVRELESYISNNESYIPNY